MDICEVKFFVGHGAPGTPAERIETCGLDAVATLRAGPHLWLVGGMPAVFRACARHRRTMVARHEAEMTGGAEETA